MAKCRSCQAKIVWAITENGKKMPIDPTPVRDGNVIKTGNRVDGLEEVHVISSRDVMEDDQRARYTAHFATCPNAKAHRR